MSKNASSNYDPVADIELMRFVDGLLDDERKSDVIAHLAAEEDDAERVHSYLRQNANFQLLREGLDQGPDEQFEAGLQQALVGRFRRQRMVRQFGAMAAALVLLASTAVASHWVWRSSKDDASRYAILVDSKYEEQASFPFGQSFGSGWDFEGQKGVDVVSNQPSVGENDDVVWLGKHLAQRSLTRPQLDGLGLRYIGSDRIAHTDAPAIRLKYLDRNDMPISVYVAVLASDVRSALSMVPEGYFALQWRLGQIVFALVAPKDSPQLFEITNMVSNAVASLPDAAKPAVETEQANIANGTGVVRDVIVPEAAKEVDPAIVVPQSPTEPQMGDVETPPIPVPVEAVDTNEPESL